MWTLQHEQALQEWVAYLGTPEVAVPTVRRKMKRLKMSPEEIRQDLEHLKSKGVTNYRKKMEIQS